MEHDINPYEWWEKQLDTIEVMEKAPNNERKTEMTKFIAKMNGAIQGFDTKKEALETAKDLCGRHTEKVAVYERSCTVKPKNEVDVVEG